MSSFRVGMKIVCVRDEPCGGSGKEIWPTKGRVYTVRELDVSPWGGDLVLRVEEIVNEAIEYSYLGVTEIWECAFLYDRFRPVVERKTDISQFQAMLNYQPKVVVIS